MTQKTSCEARAVHKKVQISFNKRNQTSKHFRKKSTSEKKTLKITYKNTVGH